MGNYRIFLFGLFLLLPSLIHSQPIISDGNWPCYARDSKGTRYSPLKQITKENLHQLKRIWTYRTGDIAEGHAHYFYRHPTAHVHLEGERREVDQGIEAQEPANPGVDFTHTHIHFHTRTEL